jgi:curved DNA-binding protein CbpA
MTARPGDPFRALGLQPRRELGDDDIRAAWRRVAAATHPDRPDGGDPAGFAAAAAAYAVLRTRDGRGEALADLLAPAGTASLAASARAPSAGGRLRSAAARIRQGRPALLAMRLLLAAAVGAVAVTAAGWQPASYAILVGLATWFAGTSGKDVVPPR